MNVVRLVVAGGIGASLLAAACGTGDTETQGGAADFIEAPVPAECADIQVDRFKELMIVDDAVLDDKRALNSQDGVWSFRHLVEELTPPGMEPTELVYQWLDSFRRTNRVNLFSVEPRPLTTRQFICPWLLRTPSNECDPHCSECTKHDLDLSAAPFRLIAIANRGDLNETEYLGGVGELRFVYAFTNGPGDDPKSAPMAGTIIFEYAKPPSAGATAKVWADRWHALGSHAAFDEPYKADLEAITELVVKRGANPAGVGGSALAQLRTNEREFEWSWDLREFKLTSKGLVVAPTRNSPHGSVLSSEKLGKWINDNADAIRRRTHVLPPQFTGGQSQPLAEIRPPGVPDDLRRSFSRETCAGCHQLDADELDFNFHIAPARKGLDRVSRFLHNPADPEHDELGYRTRAMRRALCSK